MEANGLELRADGWWTGRPDMGACGEPAPSAAKEPVASAGGPGIEGDDRHGDSDEAPDGSGA